MSWISGLTVKLANSLEVKATWLDMQMTYNYFGVSGNSRSLSSLYYRVRRLVFKWLNRRSQRKSFNWGKFQKFLSKFKLKRPRIKVDIFKSGIGSCYLSKR